MDLVADYHGHFVCPGNRQGLLSSDFRLEYMAD